MTSSRLPTLCKLKVDPEVHVSGPGTPSQGHRASSVMPAVFETQVKPAYIRLGPEAATTPVTGLPPRSRQKPVTPPSPPPRRYTSTPATRS